MGIAHELITRGWVQGSWVGRDGGVCLLGACESLAHGSPLGDFEEFSDAELKVYSEARSALVMALHGRGVIQFNDAPERTVDEVLRVAKEADEILGL